MDPLDLVFRNLDHWRHFPAYALERRADAFFSVYLKGFLEQHTGIPLEEEILPELPLKHGLLPDVLGSAQSDKIDFVVIQKDRERVLFVELKTDVRSRRIKQDAYLLAAQKAGFRRVLEGIREIILRSSSYQKYFHLASALERLGFLRIPPETKDFMYPKPRQGLTRCLQRIEVTALAPAIEVIYLQPIATKESNCFGFDQLATYVSQFSDPFSQRFAEHLLVWTEAAGTSHPTKVRDRARASRRRG